MGNAAVQYDCGAHTGLDGFNRRLDFRDHAARNRLIPNQRARLGDLVAE